MFRNGLVAARRPLTRPLPALIRPPSTALEPPFVCASCRFRGIATKERKRNTTKPLPKSQTLKSALKRLEQHVQLMQRNFVDQVKQQEAAKELPDEDITDDMKDQAYAALMAPQNSPAAFLPQPKTVAEQLPRNIVQRLGDGMHLVESTTPQWGAVLMQMELNGGLEGLETSDVNGLLTCIDLPQRAMGSAKVFEMMEQSQIAPNTLTYDLIMLAHAAVGNSVEVKELFNRLKKDGLPPTVYTYSHLLKAFSQDLDVSAAAAAFREMQAAGIEPNLIAYTTFIQTCVDSREFNIAWEIFNLIKFKSTATAPDVSTYTLMIHACAQTSEAERALDLYTDMVVRRGLTPTAETYHALIHACAVRKDYFTQAWKFAVDMQQAGMKLDRRTVNVLIQACGRVGELTRARLLVRHMMGYGRAELLPDRLTYQNLLRSYATYKAPSGNRKAPEGSNQENALFVSPNNELIRREDRSTEEEIPFLPKAVLSSSKEVLDEAASIVNWLRERKAGIADTQLLNSYLDVCLNHRGFADLKWCYLHDLQNPQGMQSVGLPNNSASSTDTEDGSPESSISGPELPKLSRNIYTFKIALQAAVKYRKLDFARQVWSDRTAFKLTAAYRQVHAKLRKQLDFEAELAMIDILALKGFLGEAVERVEALTDIYEWKWNDLRTLYVKAVQLEDAETARLIRKITRRN